MMVVPTVDQQLARARFNSDMTTLLLDIKLNIINFFMFFLKEKYQWMINLLLVVAHAH